MATYEEMGPATGTPPPPPPTNKKGAKTPAAPLREGDELNLDSTEGGLKKARGNKSKLQSKNDMVDKEKAELEKKPNHRDEIILVVVVGVFCVVLTIVALVALVLVSLIAAKVI